MTEQQFLALSHGPDKQLAGAVRELMRSLGMEDAGNAIAGRIEELAEGLPYEDD
jgi:hypothetical protein